MDDPVNIPLADVAHTFVMGDFRQTKGWIDVDNRGDFCEADTRCKQPTVVHYGCNGIDKHLCRRHYDRLLEKLWGKDDSENKNCVPDADAT